MAGMMDLLMDQLGGGGLQQMSKALGADEATTGKALSAALPVLMGALSKNAATPDGANALASALDRDHDGSILDDLPGFLQNFQSAGGDGILGHMLGGRRGTVESGISRSTGLDAGSVAKLLAMAAPMVMAALGKNKRSGGMDASALGRTLGAERQQFEQANPGAGGLLGSLLDQDGDGDIKDDVAKLGMNILGKFLGGRK